MKTLFFVLLSTLMTCFLSTSVDAILCHVCESLSNKDAYCTDTDLGEEIAGCETCVTHKMDEKRYKRECSTDDNDEACGVIKGVQVCFCKSDLCNARVRFPSLITCHVCTSLSKNDNLCTDTDLGEVVTGCSSCTVFKLDENRFKRKCSNMHEETSCKVDDLKQHVCICNSDLCNADVIFKPLVECYVCAPNEKDETECSRNNLGVKERGCASCFSIKSDDNRFQRWCSYEYQKDNCMLMSSSGEQVCTCNTPLCNGLDIFRDVIKCYSCTGESIDDTTSCTDSIFGEVTDGCLSCSTIKIKDNEFKRECKSIFMPNSCLEVANTCFCDTDLCNVEDVYLPIMKCYACEKKNPTDARCNVRNSGLLQSGCLTCRTTLEKGFTERECLERALAPGSETVDGVTTTHCNTDLCNGEGEDRVRDVTTSDPESSGLQKTVASRVLIGGLLLAILGLAGCF